jgi:hypothetical protein
VSIGSTVRDPSGSHVTTVKVSNYPEKASVSSPTVVYVPSEIVPAKAVRILASEKRLLHRGFLGSKNASHPLPAMKEASSSVKGSKAVVEESLVYSSLKKHAAELGLRLSEPFPCMSEGGAPICSTISKSQIGYARRVKEKIAKQLQKNKDLFAEVVVETEEKGAENYSEVVLDVMKFASTMGLSCGKGGDEKSLLNLFSKIEEQEPYTTKVKGKRKLKNLECSINYEAQGRLSLERYQSQRGCVGSKNAFSFPPEVH